MEDKQGKWKSEVNREKKRKEWINRERRQGNNGMNGGGEQDRTHTRKLKGRKTEFISFQV